MKSGIWCPFLPNSVKNVPSRMCVQISSVPGIPVGTLVDFLSLPPQPCVGGGRQGAECRGPRMRAGSRPSALRGLPLLPASNRQCWSYASPPGVSGPTGETFPVGPTDTGGRGCVFSLPAVPVAPVTLCAEAAVLSKILGHKSQKPDPSSPERRNGLVSSQVLNVEGAGFRRGWLQGPQVWPLSLCPPASVSGLCVLVCWPPSPTAHLVTAPEHPRLKNAASHQCFPTEVQTETCWPAQGTCHPEPIILARSAQFSHSTVSDSLRPHGLQHARLPCPSPTPGACSNSCPSSQ